MHYADDDGDAAAAVDDQGGTRDPHTLARSYWRWGPLKKDDF